jgi:hypothetical protein
MTGDFTSVPLRDTDRWTGARMQQGRVLLDTDWNLNLDGPGRDARQLALDTIGPAGVPEGSNAFEISVVGGKLVIGAGDMWIGGLLARNPADLEYGAQAEIGALPANGLAQLYLDAFVEEVQAAEDPDDVLDPALDGVDTTTRTRVGWRVHARSIQTDTCNTDDVGPGLGGGLLDVVRTSGPISPDPCAPPDDPRAKLPDGLLRIEVIDSGNENTARFAWSYADGGDAVAARVAGTAVTLAPSPSISFAMGDLVEVSTLARRADRRDHGALFTVASVTPQAGGDLVTLNTASAVAGNPPGTCLRRWDGQTVGAAGGVTATLAGADVGIAFTARSGSYLAGDWWGVRVRGSAADAVETRTAAPPDGVLHTVASLAVVDMATPAVVHDCRPTFPPLTEIRDCTCTVTAFPGDDLQAALDKLPDTGGELCLAAGLYLQRAPLKVARKRRIVITGVGPATVLRVLNDEAVLIAALCDDIEVTNVRVEGGSARDRTEQHLLGALSFLGCVDVRVLDCEVTCPDNVGRDQSAIYVAPGPDRQQTDRVTISRNRLEVGDQQVGILVVSAAESAIIDNRVELGAAGEQKTRPTRSVAGELSAFIASHLLTADAEGGQVVDLPGEQKAHVGGGAQVKRLAAEWGKQATTTSMSRSPSTREAFQRFAFSALLEPHQAVISKASAGFLVDAVRSTRSIGQGIVVGGEQADRVRIEGNHVVTAIQGIHVGLGGGKGDERTVGQVVIGDNTVENLVPFFWSRQRHAIYVGSSASTTLVDNHAHLSRAMLTKIADLRGTSVEAVRIWGRLGAWLSVRGVDLTGGYAIGVHIQDTGNPKQQPGHVLRYVSDVLNTNGPVALVAPTYVAHDRCVP